MKFIITARPYYVVDMDWQSSVGPFRSHWRARCWIWVKRWRLLLSPENDKP